jgi:hypothetical protein
MAHLAFFWIRAIINFCNFLLSFLMAFSNSKICKSQIFFSANFRRAEVVDFTKPFLSLGISIIFRIPEDYQPDIFSFLNPLSLEIWLCIMVSICGLTFGKLK